MRRTTYVTTGMMRRGKLKVSNAKGWMQALRELPDGPVEITVQPRRAVRSREANRLYWVGYVAPLAEYTGYAPAWIHGYLKKRFLSPNHLVIADTDGVVVDEVDLAPTTTTLTPAEFSAFLQRVTEFALELGVDVGPRLAEPVR